MPTFEFSNTWFNDTARNVWDQLIPMVNPDKVLEIGSYEGASACYLIDKLASRHPIELHCIDTWEGGLEHKAMHNDMNVVEQRFNHNVRIAQEAATHPVDLHIHKGMSHDRLVDLLAAGKRNHFDFIYIDGSHEAPDVLSDAVLAFRLLKIDGVIAFDDYLWSEGLPYGYDPIRCPKPAIDAFTTLYCRKLTIYRAPLCQLYIRKTAD